MLAAGRGRDPSLDALRGLAVVGMLFVNLQGDAAASFAAFVHAAWHGFTLADLVFPAFLLAVGLSVPLALDDRPRRSWRELLARAARLFAIGLLLGWLLRPSLDLAELRWVGVLQRIAIVYLVAALVARQSRGWLTAAVWAAGLLAAHTLLLLLVAAPGEGAPSLAPGQGISGWADRTLLPGRLLRGSYDPEGLLSTAPAIATGLIGVAVMRYLRQPRPRVPLILLAFALAAAGGLASLVLPLNKNLWTASFALVTAAATLAVWASVRWAWPRIGASPPARLAVILGQAALTLYVAHMLLVALLVQRAPGGDRWWSVAFEAVAAIPMLSPAWASLAFALIALVPVTVLTVALWRRGWLIKA